MASDSYAASTTPSLDAKVYKKDIYIMYADLKRAFNAKDHHIMFKHIRQLGMPSTFVDTHEQLYGVSTTD
jgi:hypothetical protein